MAPPVVVAGGSASGLGAVQGLRARGYDGDVVLVDPDPHLPYERPALSKGLLRDLGGPEPVPRPDDRLERLAVERVLGRAASLDAGAHRLRLAGGRELAYSTLVVATGAGPRRPAALDRPGVMVLRDLADARALRRELADASRVVVVGAGFLGTEVAAAAATAGRAVTVVDPLPVPVSPLGPLVAARVAQLHRDMGTDLLLGTAVTGIVGGERARGVRLADGRQVDGDLVVLALGVVPADDWLAGTPVVRDHGVVVDQFLRAAPDVLAAGDVARVFSPRYGRHLRVEHWTTALGHGDLAAAVALGGTSGAPQQELPYVWTEQFDTRICVLGRTTPSATVVEQHPDADRFVVAYTDPAGRVQGALTWNWTRRLASWRPWITAGTHLAEVG